MKAEKKRKSENVMRSAITADGITGVMAENIIWKSAIITRIDGMFAQSEYVFHQLN